MASSGSLTLEQRIDAIESRAAIHEIILRYCRALDRKDEAMLRSCFHPDSHHSHGPFTGTSSDFCGYAMDVVTQLPVTQHHLGNISITVDGDVASAEAYFVAYHRTPPSGPMVLPGAAPDEDVFIAGRYIDRFDRRNGTWLIAQRTGILDWQRFEPMSDRGQMPGLVV